MRRLLTPTLQLSIGVLLLTISLIFIAFSFGLVPNEEKIALEARARISENLAIQVAGLAGRNDISAIKETIASVVDRNSEVLSIAIRGADGKVLVGSPNHGINWLEPKDGKSTATHVQVPLLNADLPQGKIEIVFRKLTANNNIFGFSETMISFIGFIGIAGFVGYYLILKRALRELDPSRAIPERVKAAFNTLAEGILIVDESEYVVLANEAFERKIYTSSKSLLGTRVSELPWVRSDSVPIAPEFPWRIASRREEPVVGIPMSIRDRSGGMHRLMVNATRIADNKGAVRGVIATFDDITLLHEKNEQLNISIEQLNLSQVKISEQNKQLKILASNDPLTGCLNRRTFFSEVEIWLQTARSQRQPMSFLMLDADHFKSINDRFGHVVGDKVLIGLVEVIKRSCADRGLVGRYGGEEFCVAIAGLAEDNVERLADYIRQSVEDVKTWLPNGERVTISIGIVSLSDASCEIADLVKRADEALYAAKKSGRNRFVNWKSLPLQTEIAVPSQLAVGQR